MSYGRPADVRSHRRGGPRRKLVLAPWVIYWSITGLVVAGFAVGYNYFVSGGCKSSVKATLIASPAMGTLLESAARQWLGTEPSVRGKCAALEIEAKDSSVMAQALGTEWDTKSMGPAPDVWVPESMAWARAAADSSAAARMMPDEQPSLARTPTVIAMPRPMADALGGANAKVTWQDLVNKFPAEGWGKYNKDWGPFRLGMTDPVGSTAGLHALMSILDSNGDGDISPDEQSGALRLKQTRAVYSETTDQIFTDLGKADAQSADAALKYISAFPALEQDVLAYNNTNPKLPLTAVYPTNGSPDADHPYLVLNAPWSERDRQDVAKAFLTFLKGSSAREIFLGAGYRDANRAAGRSLSAAKGFTSQLAAPPRAALQPETVQQVMQTWTALTRPTNVLLVVDVSGSMTEPVSGAGKNRLELAKEALRKAVGLFADDTSAGLWAFSTRLDGSRDYRQLVPIGVLSDPIAGTNRKDLMLSSIDTLRAGGNTGLYDTLAAAQQVVLDNYRPGWTNMVVLLTDGANEDDSGGLSLDQVKERLKANSADPARKVPVVTIAYGGKADAGTLSDISKITSAPSYSAKSEFDVVHALLRALFSRI